MDRWSQSTINAPWGVNSRKRLARLAVGFFDPENYVDSCKAIGRPIEPKVRFSGSDFITYLKRKKAFAKEPSVPRVIQILQKMISTGILIKVGSLRSGLGFLSDCYSYCDIVSATPRGHGHLWLAPALGPDFLYHMCSPGVVQVSGKDKDGNNASGTGLVVGPHHIITCRHVMCDMEIDCLQTFQDVECVVSQESIYKHKGDDVAVIRVGETMQPVAGLVFQQPVIGKAVFTLGYPKIPFTTGAALTMQPGAVTCESVVSLSGENLFLYSAIARPGNSGGPVISEDGYVVGISSEDLTMKTCDRTGSSFSPHFAGVPSTAIAKAVTDMGIGIEIPLENFE